MNYIQPFSDSGSCLRIDKQDNGKIANINQRYMLLEYKKLLKIKMRQDSLYYFL